MCAYLENSVDVQSIYTTMELKKKKKHYIHLYSFNSGMLYLSIFLPY